MQALEQVRGSIDALADQLEQMSAAQKEASEDHSVADAVIAVFLREIAER